jgi:hypothetical protein
MKSTKMSAHSDLDQEPLLSRSASSSTASYSSISKSIGTLEEHHPEIDLDRSIENDVIPETAVLGRNLGWSSAYILIISRVIGSGIFATPGAIVTSVGSIGLTLTLWVAGALISWFGLAISLEYGCMLPRSGGVHLRTILCILQADRAKVKRSIWNLHIEDLDFSHPLSLQLKLYCLALPQVTVLSLENTSYLRSTKSPPGLLKRR